MTFSLIKIKKKNPFYHPQIIFIEIPRDDKKKMVQIGFREVIFGKSRIVLGNWLEYGRAGKRCM
jgi:hypothetical protein